MSEWSAVPAGTADQHTDIDFTREPAMSLGTILLVILVLLLLGAIPAWPYSQSWGYFPSGTLGIVVIVLVVLVLTGRL
jgi:asparagine N-glycosylation enzyme membrane subunit Stt3